MKNRSSFRYNQQIDYWIKNPKAGTWAAIVVGGGSLLYSGIQANQAKKAAQGAAGASQVDIGALDARARQIAQQNAADSAALEQAMTPEVPQLRRDANNQILSQMNPSGFDEFSQQQLTGLAQSQVGGAQTPLLRAAIAKARANLGLGGGLSQETQNLVTRQALAKAGTVAPGGLGFGRDITARDLGTTSLALERQRLMDASQLGGQELAMESQDANTAFNNRANILNAINTLQGVQGNQFNRALAAGQYGQSIRPPVVGLDPGSVVDLTTGNASNRSAGLASQANIYGAQSQGFGQFGGQMLGAGLLAYNNRTPYTSKPVDNGLSYV
jgi:hypothetical protein